MSLAPRHPVYRHPLYPDRVVRHLVLEPWAAYPEASRQDSWAGALAGKRVVVVHAFRHSILRQQARLAEAWGAAAERVMPPSAKVVLVPAVMNVAGRTDGLGDWRATLDTLVRRVDAVGPFDVALLSCGGLAQLLGQHLFDTNRSAVVVGGALQVWFGVLGKRWKKPAQSRSHPLAQALAAHRPGWLLHPLPEDTPSAKDLDKMGHTADGLYW